MENINAPRYCGVVYHSVGSSWGWDVTPTSAAHVAAEHYRKDWKPVPGTPIIVNILDMDNHAGSGSFHVAVFLNVAGVVQD